LTRLQNEDIELDLLGFEDEELVRLLTAQDPTNFLTDEDDAPELPSVITSCSSLMAPTNPMSEG